MRFGEKDAKFQGKIPCIRTPAEEMGEQFIHENFLAAKTGEQSKIGVLGQPRFAPALHRDADVVENHPGLQGQ